MKSSHEVILPNEDLPFKMFRFEGKDGNYFRDKHWHHSIEIFAVFEGDLTFYMNNKKYFLSAGNFIIVNSNEVHCIDSPEPNEAMVLQVPLKLFHDYFVGEQFIRFTHDARSLDSDIMELIRNMQIFYDEKKCGYEMMVKSCFYKLLYYLVTEYQVLEVTQDMLKQNRRMNRLSEITSYIKEHYDDELSLDVLADMFGYTPAYLSRMFQKYAGINYKTYFQNIRLEKAHRELTNTDHAIGDIALKHGFPNSKALSRAFYKKYGMLPSEYRKK